MTLRATITDMTDTKVGTYRMRVNGLAPDDVDRARNAVSSQLQAFAVDSTGTELTATPVRKFGALLARRGFQTLKKKMDPEAHGGARIVGLNGTVVKVHGSASQRVVANTLRQIAESASQHLNERIAEAIGRTQESRPVGTVIA